jgi:hypothetical protein
MKKGYHKTKSGKTAKKYILFSIIIAALLHLEHLCFGIML